MTTTSIISTCPTWCIADHAAESAAVYRSWAARGMEAPTSELEPFHRSESSEASGGVFVSLVQLEGKLVVSVEIGDGELTLDEAEALAVVLPRVVAIARAEADR